MKHLTFGVASLHKKILHNSKLNALIFKTLHMEIQGVIILYFESGT